MLCKKLIQTCLLAGLVLFNIRMSCEAHPLFVVSCADTATGREVTGNMLDGFARGVKMLDTNDVDEIYQMQDWEKAYLEYLESFEDRDRSTYTFIYVDDDAIPELEIYRGTFDSSLLTYHDGILDEVDIYRSGLYYIEKGNLVCNESGNTGAYFDYPESVKLNCFEL